MQVLVGETAVSVGFGVAVGRDVLVGCSVAVGADVSVGCGVLLDGSKVALVLRQPVTKKEKMTQTEKTRVGFFITSAFRSPRCSGCESEKGVILVSISDIEPNIKKSGRYSPSDIRPDFQIPLQ